MTTNVSQEEDSLMRSAAAGEGAALERLYALTASALYSYLRRLAGNRSDADDLLQTTFLNAWRSRHRFRDQGARAWLFTIARNAFLTHAAKKTAVTEAGTHPSTLPTPSEQFAATDLSRRVERALARLPDDAREAVILSRLSGLSVREIAVLLDMTEGNVRVKIHRALTQLKNYLEE
jgi:RNA polymerase sigma-70 factor (ECF subfamily)